jgi:hypothetical protein
MNFPYFKRTVLGGCRFRALGIDLVAQESYRYVTVCV